MKTTSRQRWVAGGCLFAFLALARAGAAETWRDDFARLANELQFQMLKEPAPLDVGSLVVVGAEGRGGFLGPQLLSSLPAPRIVTEYHQWGEQPLRLGPLGSVPALVLALRRASGDQPLDLETPLICRGYRIQSLVTARTMSIDAFLGQLAAGSGAQRSAFANATVVTAALSLDLRADAAAPAERTLHGKALERVANQLVWAYQGGLLAQKNVRLPEGGGAKLTGGVIQPLKRAELPEFTKPEKFWLGDYAMSALCVPAALSMSLLPQGIAHFEQPGLSASNLSSTLVRTPHVEIPGTPVLTENAQFEVDVSADQRAPNASETSFLALPREANVTSLRVDVLLTVSPEFEVVGDRSGEIIIQPLQPLSSTAVFHLRCKGSSPGKTPLISAVFTYQGRVVGMVQRSINSNAWTGQTDATPLNLNWKAVAPDYSLIITYPVDPDGKHNLDQKHFTCEFISVSGKPFTKIICDWELTDRLDTLVTGALSALSAGPMTNLDQRFANLRGAGMRIFRLLPPEIQNALWTLRDRNLNSGTLFISSAEAYLPWELAIPTRPGNLDETPLGVQYAIARCLLSGAPGLPQQVDIGRSFVIANVGGDHPLPEAANEVKYLQDNLGGKQITPAGFNSIEDATKNDQRPVLHWFCHGSNPDGTTAGDQTLALEDGTINTTELQGMPSLGKAISDKRPLVFLNACYVGQPLPGLGGVGGFPQTFGLMGATAVVAPLWTVEDGPAHLVTVEFYDRIRQATHPYLAEVVRSIREKGYRGPMAGRMTYAAYCYYGDPCTRVADSKAHP